MAMDCNETGKHERLAREREIKFKILPNLIATDNNSNNNNNQLATSLALATTEMPHSTTNVNDCFIDVAPGSSKYCKSFNSTPNDSLNHDLANLESNESSSSQSTESLVCRICHNSENPEKYVFMFIQSTLIACL